MNWRLFFLIFVIGLPLIMLGSNEVKKKSYTYKGFSWVIDGELCGMPLPGKTGSVREDIRFLQKEGITLLVSLTEKTPDFTILRAAEIEPLHLHVKDFHAPTIKQLLYASRKVDGEISKGGKVAVHCKAGKGRTGTFLAAYIVFKGSKVDNAIKKIRKLRPGSIETKGQEKAIKDFYEYLKKSRVSLEK